MYIDNFYVEDLISAIKTDSTMARYYPLIEYKDSLIADMHELNVVFRDDIDGNVIEKLSAKYGNALTQLFARYIHIYDFKKIKLRDIKQYEGTEKYDALFNLLRLPGVRLLRAELYLSSGITLERLAQMTTEEIQSAVREFIDKNKRSEIVPLTKEVNCHREVARMLLRIE